MPEDTDLWEVEVPRAIRAAWDAGSPIARDTEGLANLARRRWGSSARRGVDPDDRAARTRDLAKGLMTLDRGEELGPLKRDYEWLAEEIVKVILRFQGE